VGLGLGLILGSVYFKTDAMPTKIMGGFSQNRYAHEFPGPFDSADGATLLSKLLPQSS